MAVAGRVLGAVLGAVLAAALLTVPPAGPASAADEASITYVESTREGGLELLLSVPADTPVDLEQVGVSIDGVPVEATAESAATTASVSRTAVLVIDTSNSMRGERFEAAREAALTFIDTVPDDVRIGIVSFDSEVDEPLAPSLDRERARSVVEELALAPQTRLYDGVVAAVEMAGSRGQRTLLVLSDGADTSDTGLLTVTRAVRRSGALVDVVSLQQSGTAAESALRRLARSGRGTLIDADPDALREAFTRRAEILADQLLVRTRVPEEVTATEASVVVTLPSEAGDLTAEAFAKVRRSAAAPQVAEPPAAVPPPAPATTVREVWMYAGLGLLCVGLLVALFLMAPRPPRPLSPAERAAVYTSRVEGRSAAAGSNRSEPDQAFTEAVGKVLERNQGFASRVAARLEAAGNPLQPPEWLVLHMAVFLGSGSVGLLLGKGNVVVGILFLALGALGPWLFLGIKRSRRRKAFSAALPATLQLMSGSLAAGLSLAQSVDTIVREGVEPIASEFRRVLVETRLGVALEDALDDVAERFESKDFGWVVMAIRIQRQVGGNLAELLDTVAATIREREYMRRQVAALAAEGKLSAWVLGGLPPGFMLYLLATNRDYVMVMFTEPLGWAMLTGAVMLLGLGVFWMSRLAKVDI